MNATREVTKGLRHQSSPATTLGPGVVHCWT